MTTRVDQIAAIVDLLTGYKTGVYLTDNGVNGVDSASTKCYVYPKGEFGGEAVNDDETFVIDVKATSLANLETALNLLRSLTTGHPTTGYGKRAIPIASRTANDSAFVGSFDLGLTNKLTAISQAAAYATFSVSVEVWGVNFHNMLLARFNPVKLSSITISSPTITITSQSNATITSDFILFHCFYHTGTSYSSLLDYEGVEYWNSGEIYGPDITSLLANATYTASTLFSGTVNLGTIQDFFIQMDGLATGSLYRTGIVLNGNADFTAAELPIYLEFKTVNKDEKMFYGSVECKARWAL